jgi:fucose 4-O-acetylase-like acetyltransferase
MILLVFVHAYNLNENYLQPWTIPHEPLTFTTFTEYWLANGIFRFRIPMLFIISGYLFAMADHKPYKERVKKRVKTLLYPYLIWSFVGLLLTYVLEFFPFTRNAVLATHMMQINNETLLLHQYHWYEVLARWIFFPVSYQLWFIRVLFIYNLAYPALHWCVTNPVAKWIFFSFAVLFWISTQGLILFEGEGLLFFSIGIWIQKKNFNIDKANKWLQPNLWGTVFIVLSILKTLLAFQPYFEGIGPILLIMHKLVVLSGLIFAWYGCNWLVKFWMDKKWFTWAAAFSFIIYAVHAPFVLYASKGIMMEMSGWKYYRFLTFLVLPIVIILFAILMGAILRKFLPKLYSFVTGGRGLQ